MRGNGHDDMERVGCPFYYHYFHLPMWIGVGQVNPSTFYIIDCRSQLAANANAVMGKGIENFKDLVLTTVVSATNLPLCFSRLSSPVFHNSISHPIGSLQVLFCGIGNIHTMRASLEMLHRVRHLFHPAASSTPIKSRAQVLVPWIPKGATVTKGVSQSVSALFLRKAQQQAR
ncbi:unnamed protein product [Sphagnum jensenii]|uniref:Myotubularin phosphatase domain-containing protein n=1 Tax=Sphagnum jensenii TaxID=128206 RepID=A0ABP0VGX0_9BRYO